MPGVTMAADRVSDGDPELAVSASPPAPAVVRLAGVDVDVVSEGTTLSLVHGVDWTVRQGERWIVLGPNGAGKSTLLSVVGAWRHATRGEADVLGHRLGSVDVRTLRRKIGHVDARTGRELPPALEGFGVVITGATATWVPVWSACGDAERRGARALMRLVGCAELGRRAWGACSQGERARLMLARALVADPDLLLLDEPAAGLDLLGRENLIRGLDAMVGLRPDRTVILVTHHLEEVPASTTHALLMAGGRVVAAGPVEQVLTGEVLSDAYGAPIRVSRQDGRWTAHVLPPGAVPDQPVPDLPTSAAPAL
jgi:iron complex transport system ATP-binding protein